MVFNSVPESETPISSSSSMASSFSPNKSQPLHNFPLNLKWSSMNHSTKSNTQRFRRPNLDQPNNHPLNNNDNKNRLIKLSYPTPISNSSRIELKNEIHTSKLKLKKEKKEKAKASHSQQTVLIRLPPRSKAASSSITDVDDETQSADEMTNKTWNLRPRRLVTKQPPNNANNVQDSIRPNELTEEKDESKKQSLSVSLSKDEIEKDFLLMTGSKPSKRPKKRAKSVQRQLDVLSPGLWLTSVTPDLYRVPDPPLKG